jgi:hypothetical protein
MPIFIAPPWRNQLLCSYYHPEVFHLWSSQGARGGLFWRESKGLS